MKDNAPAPKIGDKICFPDSTGAPRQVGVIAAVDGEVATIEYPEGERASFNWRESTTATIKVS